MEYDVVWYPRCGRLVYEGTLEVLLKHGFIKTKNDEYGFHGRREFAPCAVIVTPQKKGRISEATVYAFSTIEGVTIDVFEELKQLTGGYITQTPEEAILETARELAKAIDEKYMQEEFP